MKIVSLILAAGKGTRMRSEVLPKVMHPVSGYPIIGWILDTATSFGGVQLVVGHLREQVEDFVRAQYPRVRFSFQQEQDGTGGAVRYAFADADPEATHFLILPGDTPLLKKETIERLIASYERERADLALITCILDDPARYGRIQRSRGNITGIVEYNDATETERRITEINSGVYLVSRELLAEALPRLTNSNAKREYYLTDIVAFAAARKAKVVACVDEDFRSLSGINSRVELAEADRVMQGRIKNTLMESGVTILLPDTVYVERGAVVGSDTVISPGAYLCATALIGTECRIGPHATVRVAVPQGTEIHATR
ncbi:MAG TPA: NTP transferase domain-containing protein [bacterium]|nr:NTP transferase domain-containing protein [bacterium]